MPGNDVRLALVQVAAQPDVPVGEGEHRLGLREQVEVQRVSRTCQGSTGNAPSLIMLLITTSQQLCHVGAHAATAATLHRVAAAHRSRRAAPRADLVTGGGLA